MGKDTGIEWCHHTWNPWRGCVKISAGCANCYAADMSKRNPAVLGVWGKDAARVESAEAGWMLPLKWHKAAVKAGEIRTVFVGSMMDVGEDRADLDPLRDRLMAMIALTPLVRGADGRLSGLRYLLLTKRPGVLKRYLDAPGLYNRIVGEVGWFRERRSVPVNVNIPTPYNLARNYPHLAIGVSVENQAAADERIPEALAIGAATTFLSCEPLLGPVDLSPWTEEEWWVEMCSGCEVGVVDQYGYEHLDCRGHERTRITSRLSWVIVGGESGPKARPMHPQWARGLRDQCVAAGVPFHFKQHGSWLAAGQGEPGAPASYERLLTPDGRLLTLTEAWRADEPDGVLVRRMDKHAAGRLLDGRTWDEFPTVPR